MGSHLLVFEPYHSGHRPNYLRQVLRGWKRSQAPGLLQAAVTPKLLEEDPDLYDLEFNEPNRRAEFVVLPGAPALREMAPLPLARAQWNMVRETVERLRPDHLLHMMLEHAQPGLALGGRFSYPLRVSGLLFRTSHHHALHTTEHPIKGRLIRLRKRVLLQMALRNPHIHAVFSSDPSVAAEVERLAPNARGVVLPDPVVVPIPSASGKATRASYEIEEGRKLLLMFGMLSERKGTLALLNALERLPERAARQVAVLIAGPTSPDIADRLPTALDRVRIAQPALQLLRHDTFFHDPEVQALYLAADLVLVPYIGHVGTSSVMIRAAAAGRPVLGADYSTMGIWINQYRLGQAVNTADPDALAQGILTFLKNPQHGFDAEAATALSRANNPEAYARTIFHHLDIPYTPSLDEA